MKEQLEVNRVLSLSSAVFWLNSDENKVVKEVLLSALEIVRDRKNYKIQKMQKEVDFCDQFLNCKELRI